MKKQKWTEKPVTWGGYAVLCAVCYVISMVACACYYIAFFEPPLWTGLKKSVKNFFKKITNRE